MGNKVKKKFYKKWWFWAIIIVIVIAAINGSGSSKDKGKVATDNNTSVAQGENNKDTAKENTPVETPKEEVKDTKIKAGTYKVGTELDAGEYLFIAKGMGYIQCSTDTTGALESILYNDNVKGHSYITVNEGEYIKVQGGEMYPVAEAPSVVPADGLYKAGMYKVGQDIPAGEYKVALKDTMGYIEVATDSRHQLESIVTNENIQADSYITVSEGQYLKIQGVEIQK
ncbi:hypothetical protein [Clostridium sp.]|uniref:hypothetical protein n=1 Tax=Clostridium sp. TaxID=1506 RepID=UPI003216D803